jgi:two-component system chemotaxis response regulator CheB
MSPKKIKVLIVEDTLVAQKLLKGLVLSDERFELIGIAENGKQAHEFVKNSIPDVVSMDILMPIMDGVEATRKIMQENPVPIVIVSSFYQSSEVEIAIKVLEAGAVTILPRPYGPGHPKYLQSGRRYLNTLQSMSEIKVVRRKREETLKPAPTIGRTVQPTSEKIEGREFKALAIGASAGGPEGLSTLLSYLPPNFPLPVFIVQHIDSHFAEGFASWLNSSSKLPVTTAINGEKAVQGHVYLPPGNHHLSVNANGTISIIKELSAKNLCPSVNTLFKSIAAVYGKNSIAVLLSGMGKDGAAELKHLFDLGAFTFAQDEMSSLVFGMPGEAVRIGAAHRILPPAAIANEINNLMNLQSNKL